MSQEGVVRRPRQLMHLVDHIDLIAADAGRYRTASLSARMSSTLVLLAASISMRSRKLSRPTLRQFSHRLQGSGCTPSRQLIALARMRATVVLPVPRSPENRYAWLTRLCAQRILKNPNDVLLTDDIGEALRPCICYRGL